MRELNQLEKIFKGLANKRRLAIVQLLHKKGEVSVADIADHINLSFTSTSKHLGILRQLDILDRRQESLTVYYRLSDAMPTPVKLVLITISNSRE